MSRPFAGRMVRIGYWATGLMLAAAPAADAEDVPAPLPPAAVAQDAPAPLPAAAVAQDVPASLPPAVTGESEVDADAGSGQPITDPAVTPASCKSCCGGGMINIPPSSELGTWGTGDCGRCYPGKRECDCCGHQAKTCIGRLWENFHECVCCPDPCYEGQWLALADSAFFTPGVRPKTTTRFRWDSAFDFRFPDRAEYYWARAPKGPPNAESSLKYRTFSFYTEAAADAASFFIEVPYTRVEPENNPDHSGFADINLGTKALILDCDLIQLTFQFTTYVPSGLSGKGLGTGHTALEPALLYALKLHQNTYLQGEAAYWIPIGGDPEFQGDIFHYHFSLNQLLWCCGKDYKAIGTLEYVGYSVLDGAYTDPVLGEVKARTHMASAGAGIRFFMCDKIDIGVGALFFMTVNRFADELYRVELRFRF